MIYFFTDHTLLDQQDPFVDCAFGPVLGKLTTEFRLNSVHTSNATFDASLVHPPAYAAVQGEVQIFPIGATDDNNLGDPNNANLAGVTHVNLVLRPSVQLPKEAAGMLPQIKYFIYRNVLRESICDENGINVGPKGTSEMIDAIRGERDLDYKTAGFIGSGRPFSSFNYSRPLDAGTQLGAFDPASFSIEIVMNDFGFELDEAFFSQRPSKCIFEHTPATDPDAARFLSRSQRERVLHFMDPCAFYGNLYWSEFTFRRRSSTLGSPKKPVEPTELKETLEAFANRNKTYIDIRNENNRSFGYYRFLSGDRKDLFSIYDDSVRMSFANDAGVRDKGLVSYYTNDWPLLIISGSDFLASSQSGAQVITIALPKGNNRNAVLFFEIAARRAAANQEFDDESLRAPQFQDLPDAEWREINLTIPGISKNGELTLVPQYCRLKYIRRVSSVDLFEEPAQDAIQYADHLFLPLLLPDPFIAGNDIQTFDTHRYVDLGGADQLVQIDYIGKNQILIDDNTVTLSCYPVYKRPAGNQQRSSPMVETQLRSEKLAFTMRGLDSPGYPAPWIRPRLNNPLLVETLNLPPYNPRIVSYRRRRGVTNVRWLSNADFEGILDLTIDRTNYDLNVIKKAGEAVRVGQFSDSQNVFLCLRHQSHRDMNEANDYDQTASPNALWYSSASLFLRGFLFNNNGDVVVDELDTGIRLFSKMEPNRRIHTSLRDKDAAVTNTDTPPALRCGWSVAPTGVSDRPADLGLGRGISPSATDPTGASYRAFVSNIYSQDLCDFIKDLHDAAKGTSSWLPGKVDKTCKRLYQEVFRVLIVLESDGETPRVDGSGNYLLNFIGPTLTAVGPMDEGTLMEGAMYFAAWKLTQNLIFLKDKAGLMRSVPSSNQDTSIKIFTEGWEYLVKNDPFLARCVWALSEPEIMNRRHLRYPPDAAPDIRRRSWLGVSDDGLKEVKLQQMSRAFAMIFDPDTNGLPLLDNLEKYAIDHDMIARNSTFNSPPRKVEPEVLKDLLDSLNREKAAYLSELARCVYTHLGGAIPVGDIEHHWLAVGAGDAAWTTALFSKLRYGWFTFSYAYTVSANGQVATAGQQNLSTTLRPSEAAIVHLGVFGLQGNSAKASLSVKKENAEPAGTPIRWSSELSGSTFDFVKEAGGLGDALFDSKNNVIIRDPISKGYRALEYELKSAGDEVQGAVIFYCGPDPRRRAQMFAKDFYNLFADDSFVVTDYKRDNLWTGDDAVLQAIIKVLRNAKSKIKLISIIGGGVAKGSTADEFVKSKTYAAGEIVRHQGDFFRAMVGTQPNKPFDPLQWARHSVLMTDEQYVFKVLDAGPPTKWVRAKVDDHRDNKPDPNDPNDLRNDVYPLLRYSFASFELQPSPDEEGAGTLLIYVESYTSPLVSNLHEFKELMFDDGSGGGLVKVEAGLRSATDPLSDSFSFKFLPGATIKGQEEASGNFASGAAMPNPDGRDVYNPLLSALRSCALLNAILERIHEAAADDAIVTLKIEEFWNDPSVEVRYVKGEAGTVVQDRFLSLANFRKLIGRAD